MVVEQIIDVPANRKIILDLPPDLPVGKVRISVFPVPMENSKTGIALLSMRGSCKGFDTMEKYFARKRAEKENEDRKAGIN